MLENISEQQARQALSEVGAPAADPDKYQARRIDGGWSFGWHEDARPALLGTVGWVVTDAGRCGNQRLHETAEDAVRRLVAADAGEHDHES